jgi:signal peptidase II
MARVRWLLAIAIVVSTIGCDRLTKHMAVQSLAGAPDRSMLADTVRLEYVENPGAFLGLGATLPAPARIAIFVVGNAVVLLLLAVEVVRRRWTLAAFAGTVLFIAGGVSNLIDRVVHGQVVDFLNVGIGPLRTGIFNVADLAVTFGVVIVVIAGFGRTAEPTAPADAVS